MLIVVQEKRENKGEGKSRKYNNNDSSFPASVTFSTVLGNSDRQNKVGQL